MTASTSDWFWERLAATHDGHHRTLFFQVEQSLTATATLLIPTATAWRYFDWDDEIVASGNPIVRLLDALRSGDLAQRRIVLPTNVSLEQVEVRWLKGRDFECLLRTRQTDEDVTTITWSCDIRTCSSIHVPERERPLPEELRRLHKDGLISRRRDRHYYEFIAAGALVERRPDSLCVYPYPDKWWCRIEAARRQLRHPS